MFLNRSHFVNAEPSEAEVSDTTKIYHTEPPSTGNRLFAIAAIVIGAMLVLGGVMFLFVSYLIQEPDFPLAVTIAPIVQVVMGILAAVSGMMMLNNIRGSQGIFCVAIAVVVLNSGYFVLEFITYIQSQ